MKEVLEVSIEEDVLDKLDDHEKKLDDHEKKIIDLQIKSAGFAERFTSIDGKIEDIKITLNRMENNSLQSTNILLNTMSQIAVNTSASTNEIEKENNKSGNEIKKVKLNGKFKLMLKIVSVISALIIAYVGGKYGISIR